VQGGDGERDVGERDQRVAALVRGAPGVGGAAGGRDPQRARRLAAEDHSLLAGGRALPSLEAQAGVVTGEALDVGERLAAPLLVGNEQDRQLGERLRALHQRAGHAEREDHAALHVDRPRPVEPRPVLAHRGVGVVPDDGVDVPEQQHAPAAATRDAGDEVIGVARGRAGHALELGLGGQQRRTQGDRLLSTGQIPGGRGDGDQRL
jgi:hypothetical protein